MAAELPIDRTDRQAIEQVGRLLDNGAFDGEVATELCGPPWRHGSLTFTRVAVTASGWALVCRVAKKLGIDDRAAVEALLLAGAEPLGVKLTAGEREDLADFQTGAPAFVVAG